MTRTLAELCFDPGQRNCGFAVVSFEIPEGIQMALSLEKNTKKRRKLLGMNDPERYGFWSPRVFDFNIANSDEPVATESRNKKNKKKLPPPPEIKSLNKVLKNVHRDLSLSPEISKLLRFSAGESDALEIETAIESQEGLSVFPSQQNMYLAHKMIRMNAILGAIAEFFTSKNINVKLVGKGAKWKIGKTKEAKKVGVSKKSKRLSEGERGREFEKQRKNRKENGVEFIETILRNQRKGSFQNSDWEGVLEWFSRNEKVANHAADSALLGMARLKSRLESEFIDRGPSADNAGE